MNEQHDPLELLTIKQVCELTKLSYDVVLKACQNPNSGLNASDLSMISGGQRRQWRISRAALTEWINSRSNQAGQRPKRTRPKRDEAVTEFY